MITITVMVAVIVVKVDSRGRDYGQNRLAAVIMVKVDSRGRVYGQSRLAGP